MVVLMRLSPRFTGDHTHRSCRGCWRDLPASEFDRREGGKYLASYCHACHRKIAARSGRKRYWERKREGAA